MNKYRIELSKSAIKDFEKIPKKELRKIKNEILMLEDNPRPIGSLKLTNEEGYRIRIGKYRLLYEIEDKEKHVVIYRARHRKEVYR